MGAQTCTNLHLDWDPCVQLMQTKAEQYTGFVGSTSAMHIAPTHAYE